MRPCKWPNPAQSLRRWPLAYTWPMQATPDTDTFHHILHTVQIDLGERSYPIHIGEGLIGQIAALGLPLARGIRLRSLSTLSG